MTLPQPHASWCEFTAQHHTTCRRELGRVTIAAETTAVVELHKSTAVPALITITVQRTGHRQLIPLHVEAALLIGQALDRGVDLILNG